MSGFLDDLIFDTLNTDEVAEDRPPTTEEIQQAVAWDEDEPTVSGETFLAWTTPAPKPVAGPQEEVRKDAKAFGMRMLDTGSTYAQEWIDKLKANSGSPAPTPATAVAPTSPASAAPAPPAADDAEKWRIWAETPPSQKVAMALKSVFVPETPNVPSCARGAAKVAVGSALLGTGVGLYKLVKRG